MVRKSSKDISRSPYNLTGERRRIGFNRSITSQRTDQSSPERVVNIVCPSQSSAGKPAVKSSLKLRKRLQRSLSAMDPEQKAYKPNYTSIQKSSLKPLHDTNLSMTNLFKKAQNRMVTPTKSCLSQSIGNRNSRSKSKNNKSVSRLATFSGTKSVRSTKSKKRSQSRNKRGAGPLSSLNSKSNILRSNSSLSNNVSEQLNRNQIADRERRRVRKYKAKIDTTPSKLTPIASNEKDLKLAGG